MTTKVPMLTLTMGDISSGTEGQDAEERVEKEEQEEGRVHRMTIHHPNLSKILERRQAMGGTQPTPMKSVRGGRRNT